MSDRRNTASPVGGFLARLDLAFEIALEHAYWARKDGMSPAEIRAALGERALPLTGWDDAIAAIAASWCELRLPDPSIYDRSFGG